MACFSLVICLPLIQSAVAQENANGIETGQPDYSARICSKVTYCSGNSWIQYIRQLMMVSLWRSLNYHWIYFLINRYCISYSFGKYLQIFKRKKNTNFNSVNLAIKISPFIYFSVFVPTWRRNVLNLTHCCSTLGFCSGQVHRILSKNN